MSTNHPGGATAEVAIIGAGVTGASVAFHLARLGVKRIVLLERADAPGAGSTGRATGGCRAQYGSAINIRLSLLARARLLAFREETGVDPGFLQAGYLWLASDQAQLDALRAGHSLQRAEGLREARLVDAAEAARLNPFVRMDGVLGGAFCPSDGFLRPLEILRGYLEAAQRMGAELRCGTAVTGLTVQSGRVTSVETAHGSLAAGGVVDAAGPWAGEVARLARIDLPVTPLRRQVACTVPTDALPAAMPMTLFCSDGFHLRVRDGRVLLLRPSPGNPQDPWDTSVEEGWLDAIAATACERVPALTGVLLDRARAWAGLYEMSPDHHALLGAAHGIDNLYFANGSSGHGVMHAPALGMLLAEQIAFGNARSLDVRALRPERFSEGEPVAGSGVL